MTGFIISDVMNEIKGLGEKQKLADSVTGATLVNERTQQPPKPLKIPQPSRSARMRALAQYEELCREALPDWARLFDTVRAVRRVPRELLIIEYKTDKKGAVIRPDGVRGDVRGGWYVTDPNDENIMPGCSFVIVNSRPFKTMGEAKRFAELCFDGGLP
jgi:hypothetical protein